MKAQAFIPLFLSFCLLTALPGCHGATERSEFSATAGSVPLLDVPAGFQSEPSFADIAGPTYPGSGSLKVPYNGNVSTIAYITSPAQLPDHEALAQYDDAYFQDHALVIIYESVSSGSVQVGIQSIDYENSAASVTLFHHSPSGDGTTVMTTWLLWAEVEAGLDYQWSIQNPALKSDLPSS